MDEFYFDDFDRVKAQAMATFMRNFFLVFFNEQQRFEKQEILKMSNKLQSLITEELSYGRNTFMTFSSKQLKVWEGFKYLESEIGVKLPRNLVFQLSKGLNCGYVFVVKNCKLSMIGKFDYNYNGKIISVVPYVQSSPIIDEKGIKSIVNSYYEQSNIQNIYSQK